ncbi:GntR family transcriptional regulator [Saccharopolyspora phatthalungensis]|uniref:DNA-binding GntR family transcriptional regulator n=1 Tax=Saccharopolyspora phatthalungensis TaxID=664693 RepID=A0A840QJ02_9PSEU|nr:GntR family transcriptional regulator [Saccharopolyspora phatthalungensis]MBB5158948.1 DNA-binding GntR family transcriptional regulator [Saccharopolyspora phatthalungensis]
MTTNEPDRPGGRTRLSDEVYRELRGNIVDGLIPAGSPLVEDEIAERLGVSRTPVRESIQRLAADGLAESRRRRWVVRSYSAAEVVEIYGVRAALESHAARLAALNATDAQRAAIEAQRKLMTTEDATVLAERAKANDDFHDLISGASGNKRLLENLREQRLFHFNARVAAVYSTDDLRRSSRQHGELIDAVVNRRAVAAGDVARAHVEFSLDLVLRKLY